MSWWQQVLIGYGVVVVLNGALFVWLYIRNRLFAGSSSHPASICTYPQAQLIVRLAATQPSGPFQILAARHRVRLRSIFA